jgi:phenylpropionate dioxygenase-like ring-hydroxylating dioxygenase large terminal subunit
MYINFWYPVATSEELTDEQPRRVQILGLKFVAFRDTEGQAHVLSDTCVHRGASLGKGRLKDGCVECPYHGWRYGGDGRCVAIPSLAGGEKPPARAKVDSYPIQEKYGIVFAFLGDLPEDERPPIWDVTEFDQPDWRANRLVVFEVDYYYERSVENGLDPAHNEFVHPNQGAPQVQHDFRKHPIEIEEHPWGGQFKVAFDHPDEEMGLLASKDIGHTKTDGVVAGSGHLGPNTLVTTIQFNETNIFRQYFFEAPIDNSHTRIFFLNMRHFMMEPEKDEMIIKINMQIAKEDIDVMAEVDPIRTPPTNSKEILLPTDLPIVRYREWLREWDARGWRIDWKALQSQRGDVAFAIPSPSRRTSKNWVLDTVPLLASSSAVRAVTADLGG